MPADESGPTTLVARWRTAAPRVQAAALVARDEPWPPSGGAGRGVAARGVDGGRATAQRLGCALVFFVAFGALLMAAVAWAYAGLSGAGSGVGVVVGLAILAARGRSPMALASAGCVA